jgi:hypothetical protein
MDIQQRTYKIDERHGKFAVFSRLTDALVWRWMYEADFATLKNAVSFCRLMNEYKGQQAA